MVSGHQPGKHLNARDNKAKNRDFQLISRKGELGRYNNSLAAAPASMALGGVAVLQVRTGHIPGRWAHMLWVQRQKNSVEKMWNSDCY